MAITSVDSLYIGPLLADTPVVLQKIYHDLDIAVKSAINLDGGSASAFFTPEIKIYSYGSYQ